MAFGIWQLEPEDFLFGALRSTDSTFRQSHRAKQKARGEAEQTKREIWTEREDEIEEGEHGEHEFKSTECTFRQSFQAMVQEANTNRDVEDVEIEAGGEVSEDELEEYEQ